jgi:glycosyltransferase involved in cell wall biosynthesis
MESVTQSKKNNTSHFIEQIIVDDGSTDNTPEIVKEYAKLHPHIHFIELPQNKGTNASRNIAITKAKGEWCILLDSDDYFVENAIEIITNVLEQHSGYKHYMFAPDDMQSSYKKNFIIKGAKEKILLYPDFLNGHITGDFVHVCNTNILRKHPFDERIRIYEGVFFLQFYKDAQQMYFTNKVVTIRERNRQDSVTRDTIRTNRKIIERNTINYELYLRYFGKELEMLGMQRRLSTIHINLLDNYILLCEYKKAKQFIEKTKNINCNKKKLLHLCYKMRMGWIYRCLLKGYLIFKYEILNKDLRL